MLLNVNIHNAKKYYCFFFFYASTLFSSLTEDNIQLVNKSHVHQQSPNVLWETFTGPGLTWNNLRKNRVVE